MKTETRLLAKLVMTSVAGVCFLVGIAASAADAVAAKPARITFDDDIVPIFRDRCFGCHNEDKKKDGLALTTFTQLMPGGSSGEALIEPGEPDASRLYLLVSRQERPVMPKGRKLDGEDVEVIEKWIAAGALENRGSKV